MAVEAKADESFGQTVEKTLSAAHSRLKNNPRSKGIERVNQLCASLFGSTPNERDIFELRYQLLTATAAAMAEAERRSAQRAVVMIHEFVTPLTTDKKSRLKRLRLDQFVARLSGRHDPLKPGTIQGPFKVPGNPEISLYFGKAVVNKR